MPQYVNSTDAVLCFQIETGKGDEKIVPGEIVESRMNPDYLATLGLKPFEKKEGAKKKEEKKTEPTTPPAPEAPAETPKTEAPTEPTTPPAPEAPKK